MTRRPLVVAAAFLILALVAPAGAQPKPADDLAKRLVGTWVLVGTPDSIGEVPESGGRLKFFTGRHWCVTEADPDTGKVVRHFGGTYTLRGDTYVETVKYGAAGVDPAAQQVFRFRVKVEGDTYTQTALNGDNPFTEVWKRAK